MVHSGALYIIVVFDTASCYNNLVFTLRCFFYRFDLYLKYQNGV